jgi:hypothetical protein
MSYLVVISDVTIMDSNLIPPPPRHFDEMKHAKLIFLSPANAVSPLWEDHAKLYV